MIEPPDLSDGTILAVVRAGYGIDAASLAFLPIGRDSSAWVYRLGARDGRDYFLKVRAHLDNQPALLVPRLLGDRGVGNVIAPIPTATGALWIEVERFVLILYPFIDGAMAREHGMDQGQWSTFGAVLRQIHAVSPAPDLARRMTREAFTPPLSDLVRRFDADIAGRAFADPIERELATFWRDRQEEIRTLLERSDTLGRRLRDANPPLVLCHGDIHTWNVLIDTEERLWIVDWDETVLAPKERDLMFVLGGIAAGLVRPDEEAWFLDGYGETVIDPLALAYYRYAWAVWEMGAWGEQVFLMPETGEATRRDALRGFISLFAPGNIVAIARGSEHLVPE